MLSLPGVRYEHKDTDSPPATPDVMILHRFRSTARHAFRAMVRMTALTAGRGAAIAVAHPATISAQTRPTIRSIRRVVLSVGRLAPGPKASSRVRAVNRSGGGPNCP